jgi:hypothetical protein
VTKYSGIIIRAAFDLQRLPEAEKDVVRRFLFEHVQGLNRQHQKRWMRLWGRIFNAGPDELHQLMDGEEREGRYHRMHRAVLTRLFESQERFPNEERLHDWLKVAVGYVDWAESRRVPGLLVPIPKSTAFGKCSEVEIRELHRDMEDWLRSSAYAQRRLWRHLKPTARAEMVEHCLTWRPDPQQESETTADAETGEILEGA